MKTPTWSSAGSAPLGFAKRAPEQTGPRSPRRRYGLLGGAFVGTTQGQRTAGCDGQNERESCAALRLVTQAQLQAPGAVGHFVAGQFGTQYSPVVPFGGGQHRGGAPSALRAGGFGQVEKGLDVGGYLHRQPCHQPVVAHPQLLLAEIRQVVHES